MGNRQSGGGALEHDESLRLAVRFGDLASTQMALRRGANPNSTDPGGSTPLHVAALVGQVTIINMLLAQKSSIDIVNKDGRTPLHCAAHGGNAKAVRALIEGGAFVEARDDWGDRWAPIHYASRAGNVEVVSLLLETGSRVNLTTERTKVSALHVAARAGSIETVRLLLREGADTSLRDATGQSFIDAAPDESVAAAIRHELEKSQNDAEVVQRRQGTIRRPTSSLKIRNTAKRLATQRVAGRTCAIAVSLWAPPNFSRGMGAATTDDSVADMLDTNITADDATDTDELSHVEPQPGGLPLAGGNEALLDDIDLHYMEDPRVPRHLLDDSDGEDYPLTRATHAALQDVPTDGDTDEESEPDDTPDCTSGGAFSCAPKKDFSRQNHLLGEDPPGSADLVTRAAAPVKVVLRMGHMAVVREYPRYSVQLKDLRGEAAMAFALELNEVALLRPEGVAVKSTRQLRALLGDAEGEVELTVEIEAPGAKARMCGECRG